MSARGLGMLRVVGVSAALMAVSFTLASGAVIAATAYTLVPAQSTLSFVGTQQGEKFTGVIRDFDARIQYGPEDLPGSRIEVAMRPKSIDTKSPDRDQALATADWFAVGTYPTASFRATAIRSTAAGPVAEAELSIKGHTRRLLLPFTLKPAGTQASFDARVVLDRLDFGLGAGEWADDSLVGRKVEVVVHLTLVPSPAVGAPIKGSKLSKP